MLKPSYFLNKMHAKWKNCKIEKLQKKKKKKFFFCTCNQIRRKYWNVNNLNRWEISQNFFVNGLREFNIHLNWRKILQKIVIKIEMKDIFLMLIINIQRIWMNFIMFYHFYLKNKNWKSRKTWSNFEYVKKICESHKEFNSNIKS